MAFDFCVTGNTKLDTNGFTKGMSSMTVAAGTLIADLVKTAGSGLTNLAKSAISVGASFDASMSQVAATMGTSVDQIQSLTDTALEMGRSTKFTASQAADALNYLALAGYDADKAAEVLPSVLNLAAAGGMDLAYASDLVTKAMASLRIEATKSNVDEFGDKLVVAASHAGATVSQLGEAILTVGGTAANLKGGTTELTTALGKLADVGYVGAEGGTHLRNVILALQSPTKDAAGILDSLGISVYDAEGKMRGLDEILTDLNTAMDGMTQGQKDSIISTIFNKTDLAAVNGLLAAQGEQWDTLAEQIDSASGSMQEMADTQIDNLEGAKTIMDSAFEGFQLAIYRNLEPALTDAVKMGTDMLTTLTEALTNDGPEAMLQAAGEIIASLSSGIVQRIPAVASSATQIITHLVAYLADHQDEIFDAGLELLEQLIIGITDNLPELITSAAELIAKFSAALISHTPDILACGAALLTTLVDGIIRSIENLGEAALACIAKLTGVWDGSMDEWGRIGENIVTGLLNGITGMWGSLVSTVKGKVTGMVSTVKDLLGIHSPSKVFTEIGENVTKGFANGINAGTPEAEQAIRNITETLNAYGPDFASAGAMLTTQLRDKLNDGWDAIQEDIQTDALGAIESLATALKNGDLEKLGLWAASYFWHACTAEQQTQIQSLAMGALNQLSAALNNVGSDLASLAMSLVAKFVPAAASATAGQTALNVAMDANPIGLVLSLIGLLVGALVNFAGTNESVANGFKKVWYGVEDVLSVIFESILRVLGLGVQGFVDAVNAVIDTYNWVADKLGLDTISRVSNPLWDAADKIADRRKQRQEERNSSSSSSADPSSDSSSTPSAPKDPDPAPDPTPDNTDAIEDNTAAILAANEKLAEMVRQADGLVLSDNMAVTRTVAASGTAQVAAAANNYHREGDTNITQNIYSKAQTAADLQREARWEADRAKATKR